MKKFLIIALALVFSANAGLCSSPLRVAFVGDPQVDSEKELWYAQKSIYRELRERGDLDLVVFLGDLVNDKVELLEPTRRSLDSLGVPYVCAPGNHDKDVYKNADDKMCAKRDTRSFGRIIHAPDTSFVAGGVRFIVMDDVWINSGYAGYAGGLVESQKEWLAGVVAKTKEPVVFCTHIPVWELRAEARDSLSAILSPAPDLMFVCGHTHTVVRTTFEREGRSFHVLDAGATCGSWWRGPKGENGVPQSIMNCGAPQGYFVGEFSDKGCRLSFKAVGRESSDQMAAYADSLGTLTVNVFGGAMEGKLQLRRGLRWVDVPRADVPAPEILAIKKFNKGISREYRREHKDEIIPALGHASSHIWVLPESGVKPGRKLTLRYSDPLMSFKTRTTAKAEYKSNN